MNTSVIIEELAPLIGHRICFVGMKHGQDCRDIVAGIPASCGDGAAIYFQVIFDNGTKKGKNAVIRSPWIVERILWCDACTVHICCGNRCETIRIIDE